MIASDVKLIATVATLSLVCVLLLYKEFRLVTFDAGFARVQGWPASLIDFLLMLLVSITVIIALPAAGVVLTAALLILPAVAARFWTEWLAAMLVLSALFGAVIGAAGTLASTRAGGMPTGPMIVLVGASLFLVTLLFARRRGLIAKAFAEHRSRQRLDEQKLLLAAQVVVSPSFTVDALLTRIAVSPRRLGRLLQRAARSGLLEPAGTDTWRLTDHGFQKAAAVARAHRLWQQFFTDYPESVSLFTDLDVEQIDEQLSGEMVAELEAKLRAVGESP
jgi:manganese/zinc/iron transport system permease protein